MVFIFSLYNNLLHNLKYSVHYSFDISYCIRLSKPMMLLPFIIRPIYLSHAYRTENHTFFPWEYVCLLENIFLLCILFYSILLTFLFLLYDYNLILPSRTKTKHVILVLIVLCSFMTFTAKTGSSINRNCLF